MAATALPKSANSAASFSSTLAPSAYAMVRCVGNSRSTWAPAGPGAPVLDVVGEGPLPAVEIDGGQALAAFHQRHGNIYCDRGFSGAPLLVSDHDDMGQTTRFDRGVQHGCASKQLGNCQGRHSRGQPARAGP